VCLDIYLSSVYIIRYAYSSIRSMITKRCTAKMLKVCGGCQEWWRPAQIIFCREQVIFLIKHLSSLEEGNYPTNPAGSGYVDAPTGDAQIKPNAYFVIPVLLAAEINSRLPQHRDAKQLILQLEEGIYLTYEAETLLRYVTGWRRKETSFPQWRSSRKHYHKVTKSHSNLTIALKYA